MAASGVVVRVLTRGKRISDSVPVQLLFTQSVVDFLCEEDGDMVDSFFWTEQNPTHVVVSKTPRCAGDKPIRIKRPSFCPIHHLEPARHAHLGPAVLGRGIDVGAAVLVESSDGDVLLVRRATHMRTFPNIWVPAGGHLDQGETTSEAGFRELQEETGLHVTDELLQCPASNLCIWESTFPPKLTAGLPKRHHVILYIHCKLRLTTASAQALLKPDHNEVGACAWFNHSVISQIVSANEEKTPASDTVTEGSLGAYKVLEDDSLVPIQVPLSNLFATSDGAVEDKERVSTGTKWALENWLILKQQAAQPTPSN